MNSSEPDLPAPSASAEQLKFERSLKRRAGCQRQAMIMVAIWILAWGGLVAEDLITHTMASGGWWSAVWLDLIFSPFLTVPLLMLALIGRLLGSLRFFRSYRYHLTMALPTMAMAAMLMNSLLIRLQPERRFEKLVETPIPTAVELVGYESVHCGLDSTVQFHFRGDNTALDELIEVLDFSKKSERGPESYSTDRNGCLVTLDVDRTAGSADLHFSWY